MTQPMQGLPPEQGLVILDLADDAIISIDEGNRILLFNKGAERIFGYSFQEVYGKSLDMLMPERFGSTHLTHVREFAAGSTAARRMGERREILGRRKDGSEFPAEASISKVHGGNRSVYTAILRDVTDRRRAEEQIHASLREKEILLKEIHHRVKNNLQVISSLLGLQTRTIQDEKTRSMFQESQNRIYSMALLHEALYQSENLSDIDCGKYIGQLCAYLLRSYGDRAGRIHLQVETEAVNLSLDTAVPVGLVVNELISNSLRHAFPDDASGEIQIAMRREGDSKVILSVADNGVGLPEGIGFWNTRSLGLRLVRMLSEQLKATLDLQAERGTRVTLSFPVTKGEAKQ